MPPHPTSPSRGEGERMAHHTLDRARRLRSMCKRLVAPVLVAACCLLPVALSAARAGDCGACGSATVSCGNCGGLAGFKLGHSRYETVCETVKEKRYNTVYQTIEEVQMKNVTRNCYRNET